MSAEHHHDPARALRALAMRLGDRDHDLAAAAARSMEQAGQEGIDAILWGLSHPDARVRRGCAEFLDHHATDACFPQIRWAALHDPAAKVRRVAVHSATCQRCKPAPLTADIVGLLVQVALEDPNKHVRAAAVAGLRSQPRDARAVAALEHLLRTETDASRRIQAHQVLKYQDPGYKARVDEQARRRGIAAARNRT